MPAERKSDEWVEDGPESGRGVERVSAVGVGEVKYSLAFIRRLLCVGGFNALCFYLY